jgi:solute carrier family 25 carnitine/acylcarnitine transporter 20/29
MSSASASTPETIRDDIKVAEPKPVNQTIAQLRSLVAGAAGGVCAVVVGHPFDLVKVRMQTAQKGVYSGAMDVVRKTVAREGLVRVSRSDRSDAPILTAAGNVCGCLRSPRRRYSHV